MNEIANINEAFTGIANGKNIESKIHFCSEIDLSSAPLTLIIPSSFAIKPEPTNSASALTPKITNGFVQRL